MCGIPLATFFRMFGRVAETSCIAAVLALACDAGCGDARLGESPNTSDTHDASGSLGTSGVDTGSDGACSSDDPLPADAVRTTNGAVQGVREDGITRFLGIPYAAAPIDDLRWQPPQPPACWSDVRA